MPDEKELTIEEIKMLISIESLLPALLNKIETIDKRIDNLVEKINDNVKIVNEYKKAVKTAMDGQVTQNEFNGKIRELTKAIENLEKALNTKVSLKQKMISESALIASTPEPQQAIKREPKKTGPRFDARITDMADGLLQDTDGTRTRRKLTLDNVVKRYKCTEEEAQEVLKYLEYIGSYNSQKSTLYFK